MISGITPLGVPVVEGRALDPSVQQRHGLLPPLRRPSCLCLVQPSSTLPVPWGMGRTGRGVGVAAELEGALAAFQGHILAQVPSPFVQQEVTQPQLGGCLWVPAPWSSQSPYYWWGGWAASLPLGGATQPVWCPKEPEQPSHPGLPPPGLCPSEACVLPRESPRFFQKAAHLLPRLQ